MNGPDRAAMARPIQGECCASARRTPDRRYHRRIERSEARHIGYPSSWRHIVATSVE
jgi:hypothetical protein